MTELKVADHIKPNAIRVWPAETVDGRQFATRFLMRAWPDMDRDSLDTLVTDAIGRELTKLPNIRRQLGTFDKDLRRALFGKASRLDEILGTYFDDPADPANRTYVSLPPVSMALGGDATATARIVVWVRMSPAGIAHLLLFDAVRDEVVGAALGGNGGAQRPHSQPDHIPDNHPLMKATAVDPTALEVMSGIVQMADSVAWALPPPWGAIATGALTVFQMLLGTLEPKRPDPFAALEKNLEDFMKNEAIRKDAQDFQSYALELKTKVGNLGTRPEDIPDVGRDYLFDTKDFLSETSRTLFLKTNGYLKEIEDLLANSKKTYKIEDYANRVSVGVTGLALWVLFRKVQMQLLAAEAGYAERIGDQNVFLDKTASWHSEYREITNTLFGNPSQSADKGWLDKFSNALKRIRTERLGMIELTRFDRMEWESYESYSGGPLVSYQVRKTGAIFTDHAGTGPDARVERYDGTTTKGCHEGTKVDAFDELDMLRKPWVALITQLLDHFLNPAQASVDGWRTALTKFAEMLPPPRPKNTSTVKPMDGGPPVPRGTWIKGGQVQYAVQMKVARGPSECGPWSKPCEIGDTAFATVSLPPFPADAPADAVWLVKRKIASEDASLQNAKIHNIHTAGRDELIFDDEKE